MTRRRFRALALSFTALSVSVLSLSSPLPAGAAPAIYAPSRQATVFADWPAVKSAVAPDAKIEARAREILSGMTLRQKIGQMTQPDIRSVTPEEVRQYYIGSVLNGGGAWPSMNKHASLADWLKLSDAYYDASMSTDMAVKVPVIWGTDAVHGHSNVYGATIFPHNIGLGAAHDPALIGDIAKATAQSVRATGITWTFAPTVAVVQDQRWGRAYEGYSSDPYLVETYARAMVTGLQGDLKSDGTVLATAKHFIGDGGTYNGVNEGENRATRADMINSHGRGYYSAIAAGAQTVMASYNSWNDVAAGMNYGKMHGSHVMLSEVLKGKIGFDGIVVSDWNGIAQVPGCSKDHCAQAINAGLDLIMVPDDWKSFIENTVKDVESGIIPMSRIDDAVLRILRVKLRSDLFLRKPSQGAFAGREEAIRHRDLARRAVRESLVLLKNNGSVLPLKRSAHLLVVGAAADSFSQQTGGWSLTWQGTENRNSDFPVGDTLLAGIVSAAGAQNVTYAATADGVDVSTFDAVIAVVGEQPYAETAGDVKPDASLWHAGRYPADAALLKAVAGKGVPVITVLLSGRTLYVNDLINTSDAFVAAFLPGTEGAGVADVLLRKADGRINHDFRGRLSFDWPGAACPATGYRLAPLFKVGYGLSYTRPAPALGTLDVLAPKSGCLPHAVTPARSN